MADYATSVQGVMLRVTRLNSTGGFNSDASGTGKICYISNSFMSFSFTVEFEDGDEITEKNASGEICVSFKAPDTLKRVTIELAVCDPDPELSELLGGGSLITDGGNVIGYAAPAVGEDPMPYGVALEVWSYAVLDGERVGYWWWLFPNCKLRASGDRVIENGMLANTFSGYGVGNSSFDPGPGGDWLWPTNRPYQYVRTDEYPTTGASGAGGGVKRGWYFPVTGPTVP